MTRKVSRARGASAGLAIAALTATTASADAWTCRNIDFEISCDAQGCAAAPAWGFTPMGVSVTADSLTVCAYSGCWSGPARVRSDGPLLYAAAPSLTWRGAPDAAATAFQVAFDTETGVGAMVGAGYAHPVRCESQPTL